MAEDQDIVLGHPRENTSTTPRVVCNLIFLGAWRGSGASGLFGLPCVFGSMNETHNDRRRSPTSEDRSARTRWKQHGRPCTKVEGRPCVALRTPMVSLVR